MINGIYVIDVRSREEWEEDHIDGAIHIPVDEIGSTIASVVTDRNAPVAFYCMGGHRAGIALDKARRLGYGNAVNLGGICAARKELGKK